MSLEFREGERYIVLDTFMPFIGTFVGVTADNLRFRDVTRLAELDDQLSVLVPQNQIIDAEPNRQRIVPADTSSVAEARALAT